MKLFLLAIILVVTGCTAPNKPMNMDSFKLYAESQKYENKKCSKSQTQGARHTTFMSSKEVCENYPSECNDNKRSKMMYCNSKNKHDCYENKLWSSYNPQMEFAKGIPYKIEKSNTKKVDGDWVTTTCVFW